MTTYDALVVLGAAVGPDRYPRPALRARLDTAIAAYRAGRAPRIIVTGRGEADPMRRYLEERGISPTRIACEDRARSTRQNAIFVARMVSAESRLLVVTQGSHLPRALGLFRAQKLTVDGLAAEEHWGFYPRARERVAYVLQALMGWLAWT